MININHYYKIKGEMITANSYSQAQDIANKRLEELRKEIKAERISWGEIVELVSLKKHIQPDDVELLEWAGVPER